MQPEPSDIRPDLRARLRSHAGQPLFRGAYSLMASTVLTAVLGIGFWAVAARTTPAAEVGRDAALISSLITLSAICQLNLIDALVRFLPGVRNASRARVLLGAYAATAAAGALGGAAFVLVAPHVSRSLAFLGHDHALALSFVGAMALWGVFVLQDSALAALRRAAWIPVENAGFAIAKIALLPVLVTAGAHHEVFLSWVVPTLVAVPVVNGLLLARVLRPAAHADPDGAAERTTLSGRALARFLAQDYGGFVLGQAAVTLVPLVVVASLGSAASAYFYMPFTLVVAFDLLFANATTSMTVEGAHDEQRTAELAGLVARRFLAPLVPIAFGIALAAPLLLAPFGRAYVHHGTPVLRLLALGSIARAVVCLFVSVSRLTGHGRAILVTQGGVFVLVVGLALLLSGPHGLTGVGIAWLAGNGAVAAAVAPGLLATLRPRAPASHRSRVPHPEPR